MSVTHLFPISMDNLGNGVSLVPSKNSYDLEERQKT